MPSVSYADFASSLLHFSCIKLNYAVVGGCVGVSDNIPLSNFICSGSGIGSVLLAFVVIDYLHTVRSETGTVLLYHCAYGIMAP